MKHLTKRMFVRPVYVALLAALLSGCSGGTTGGSSATTVRYDFNAGKQGWVADFSDLPENYEPLGFELAYNYAALPTPLDTTRKAVSLTSHNRSDDLWYFLKRQITGLRPNTRYSVRFAIEIASDAPESAFGIGGGEGTNVVLKADASPIEPLVSIGIRDSIRARVFNLDKGEQLQDGNDVVVLGNIAIPGEQKAYTLKQLNSENQSFFATTASQGRLWAFFGTESGFEGLQTIYYTSFQMTLTPA